MQSRRVVSMHQMAGFSAWLLTFSSRNRMHRMTATAVRKAGVIVLPVRTSWPLPIVEHTDRTMAAQPVSRHEAANVT